MSPVPSPSERRRREEEASRRTIELKSQPYDARKMRPRTSWGCVVLFALAIATGFYLAARLLFRWLGVL